MHASSGTSGGRAAAGGGASAAGGVGGTTRRAMWRSAAGGPSASPARSASAAPRPTHRITSWRHHEDITELDRKRGVGGVAGRHLDQGVLPPFPEVVKGLTGQFLDLQRRKAVDSQARYSSLGHGETIVSVVPRDGEKLGWAETSIRGRGTVPGKLANLNSEATATVMASNWTRGDLPTIIGRADTTHSRLRRNSSLPPPGTKESTSAEDALASTMQARSATWRAAFLKFPRQSDGAVSTDDFAATLSKLASTAAVSTDGAATARAGGKTLTAADIKRVVHLVDPANTGVVTFPTFAAVFSRVLAEAPPATSLGIDGTPAGRTHTKAHLAGAAPTAGAGASATKTMTSARAFAAPGPADGATVPAARYAVPPPPASGPRSSVAAGSTAATGGDEEGAGSVVSTASALSAAEHRGAGDTDAEADRRSADSWQPRARLQLGGGGGHDGDGGDAPTAAGAGTPRSLEAGGDAAVGAEGMPAAGTPSVDVRRAASVLSESTRKRAGATRATTVFAGADRLLPSDARAAVSLSTDILTRTAQLFGTNPSSLRRLFVRMPRTKDGTSSLGEMVASLKEMGVLGATTDAMASLLGMPRSASTADAASQRVSYDAFALALASTSLNKRPVHVPPPLATVAAATAAAATTGSGGVGSESAAAAAIPASALLAVANATHAYDQMASTQMLAALTDPLAAADRLPASLAPPPDRREGKGSGGHIYAPADDGFGGGSVFSGGGGGGGGPGIGRARSVMPGAYTSGKRLMDPDQVLTADALQRVRDHLNAVGATPTQLFLRMDKQRDGFLTHAEIKRGLTSLGVHMEDADYDRVLHLMDREGTGAVDHPRFIAAVFPPDIHPRTKAFPFQRAARSVKTRKARVERQKWAATPSYDMMRSDEDADAAPVADTGSDVGEGVDRDDDDELHPSWLDVPTVDMMGMYQTERDVATEGVTAGSRRHFNMDQPAPYLHGTLQARDTWGTPAPHLAPPQVRAALRLGAVGSIADTSGGATELERTMWTTSGRYAAAAADPSATLGAPDIQRGKRQNAILRRVVDKLSCRTADPRKVWLRLNNNHDGTCDARELREGLARMGVHLNADEFKLFLGRIDVDASHTISFDEFARAFKGDDPIPDEMFLAASGVSPTAVAARKRADVEDDPVLAATHYRRHRYIAASDAPAISGQGAPRNQGFDSRGTWLSLQSAGGGAAAAAASLEEARMQLEVVDRLEAKSKRGIRDIFCRLAGEAPGTASAASATLPADPAALRERLAGIGVTMSERQVAAFLRPVLDARAGGASGREFFAAGAAAGGAGAVADPGIDYRTFVELSRPRALLPPGMPADLAATAVYGGAPMVTRRSASTSRLSVGSKDRFAASPLRSPLPIGQARRSSVDAGHKPLLGTSEGEGVGRYGNTPDTRAELAAALFPVNAADYVRKTNTSATGTSWDDLANASAQADATTAAAVTRAASAADGSGEGGGTSTLGKTAGQVAAEAEWAGMPIAGKLSLESGRRARIEMQYQRSVAADSVRDLLRDGGGGAAGPSIGTFVSAYRGDSAWMSSGVAAGSSGGAAPGGPIRRSASAEPSATRSARLHVRTSPTSAAAPAATPVAASPGSSPTTRSASVLRSRRPEPSVPLGASAGIASPRQARVVALSTMLASEDAVKSRKGDAGGGHGRMFAAPPSGIFSAAEYPAGDPGAIADVRYKVRRSLYSQERAARVLEATSGGGGGTGGAAAATPAASAVAITPRPSHATAGSPARPQLQLRGTEAATTTAAAAEPAAGVSSPRQPFVRHQSSDFGLRPERRHYPGHHARMHTSVIPGLSPQRSGDGGGGGSVDADSGFGGAGEA